MYRAGDYETVNLILRNPAYWNKDIVSETLQRFNRSNSYSERDFNTLAVQEIIRNYLLTLSEELKREESEETLHDFEPFWVSGV